MNVALWILQGVLAAFFLMAGVMKSTMPRERLIASLPWVEDFSTPAVRFIGGAELLGALGLILPAVTGIAPILTPIAASALAVVMVLAGFTHYRRREPSAGAFNAVVFVVAAMIAWGRFGPFAF
jgi:uncharacterized membrane protein